MPRISHKAPLSIFVLLAALGGGRAFPQAAPALPGSTPPSVAPRTPPGSYALSDLETIELV